MAVRHQGNLPTPGDGRNASRDTGFQGFGLLSQSVFVEVTLDAARARRFFGLFTRQSSRGTPDAATDIEDPMAGLNLRHFDQFIRRGNTAHMKHIESMEILDCDFVGGNATIFELLECTVVAHGQL
ncbi:MAG: hypothetical protein VX741_12755 [Pseudomonadota bacterium]|nr:hypothetical protein [Pseudomonadota bacterium]